MSTIIDDVETALALLMRDGYLWERLGGSQNLTGHDVTSRVAEHLIRKGYAAAYNNRKGPRKLYWKAVTDDSIRTPSPN